jgi:ABC-type sugar transport system substrate-binding protein
MEENIMKKISRRNFLRSTAVAAASVGAAGLLGACGTITTDTGVTNASSTTAAGTAAAAASTAKDPYGTDVKIAFLPNVIGDSCAAAWAKGMKSYLDNFATVTFDVFDGKASVDTEVSVMDDLINQAYDCIILQATDAAGLAASAQKAEAAGIPVVTVNLDAATTHYALVAAVDVEAGQQIANAIGTALNGTGNVLIISATPGATKGENIDKGFKDVMSAQYSGIKILDEQTANWLTEDAYTVMNDFLTKYPDINAVMCHNDAMAEGAAEAIKAAGKTADIAVWGCDGETKMLEYIEQGLCTGTIYTNCVAQGQSAAQFAMMAIGTGVNSTLASTPIIKMSPVVVTAENVASITDDIRW